MRLTQRKGFDLLIRSIDAKRVFCYPISINQWQTEGGNKMNLAAIIWFALMVVFLVVEAACPIHLVSIWFAVGSLAAMIVSLFGGLLWLQVTVFCVVSGALLQYVSYSTLFPYAMFFTACAICTMSRVKHGDSRPAVKKKALEHFDVED